MNETSNKLAGERTQYKFEIKIETKNENYARELDPIADGIEGLKLDFQNREEVAEFVKFHGFIGYKGGMHIAVHDFNGAGKMNPERLAIITSPDCPDFN